MPRSTRAYLAWLIVCLVWGTTYLAIRVAIETIPPFLMAGARWAAAGLLLIGVLAFRGHKPPPPATWPLHALLGILMVGLGNGAVVWAEQTVPTGLAAILIALTPFWMLGIERLVTRAAPLGVRRVMGLIVGFCGVVLLVWPEVRARTGMGFLWGVMATQVAAFGWSLGSNLSRRRPAESHVLAVSSLQMVFGGLFLLGLAAVTREAWPSAVSLRSMIATLYLLFAGSIVAYSAYAYALRHLPLATVSMYAYVNPVIAVALGTLVLHEPMTWRLVLAGGMVLGSVLTVRK